MILWYCFVPFDLVSKVLNNLVSIFIRQDDSLSFPVILGLKLNINIELEPALISPLITPPIFLLLSFSICYGGLQELIGDDVGAKMMGELGGVYGGRHYDHLCVHFVLAVQDFFESDESEIHLQGSLMHFIQDYVGKPDAGTEEELLDQDPIGHIHNFGLITCLRLHANLIANSFAHRLPILLTDPGSQTRSGESPGLAYCNIGIGLFLQDVLRDLS